MPNDPTALRGGLLSLALLVASIGCVDDARPPSKGDDVVLDDLLGRFAECRNWEERRLLDVGRPRVARALGEGFSGSEQDDEGRDFVWATRPEVDVRFESSEARPTHVTVRLRPFQPPSRPAQTMNLTLNGAEVGTATLVPGFEDYAFSLPEEAMRRGANVLHFTFGYAAPASEGDPATSDTRSLAAALDSIGFDTFDGGEPAYVDEDGALILPRGTAAVFEIPERHAHALRLSGFQTHRGHLAVDAIDAEGVPTELGRVGPGSLEARIPLPPAEGGVRRVQLVASSAAAVRVGAVELLQARTGDKEGRREHRPARPDVVVFLVDTLRRDRVGAFGNSRGLTPNVDALASEAVRFDQAMAQAPWTKPAVSSLFTSLDARHHGVNRFGSILPDGAITLAEVLRDAGYRTVAVSGSPPIRRQAGFDQGFEVFEEVDRASTGEEWPPSPLVLDRLHEVLERGGDDRPLFLYVHVTDPHSPYAPPASLRARFAPDTHHGSITAGQLSPQIREEAEALYDADVALADQSFGRFIDLLRRHGLYDESFVLFLADHGEQFYEHHGWRHSTNYAEVIRIPMILKPPASSEIAPRAVEQLVRQIDLLPTLAGYLGIEPPGEIDGRDLGPTIRGEAAPAGDLPPSLAYVRYWEREDYAIVAPPWKLMLRMRRDGSVGRRLYRVSDDPLESQDLADEEPRVADRLERELRARAVDVAVVPRMAAGVVDPEVERALEAQLRALGYAD